MAIKGNIAKENVIRKIAEAFGNDWIGEKDKKYYVWASDGGEKVQIAISLTCPKTFIDSADSTTIPSSSQKSSEVLDFESFSVPEMTEEERKRVNDLIKKLNL